jgi:hypothetical protein
MTRTYTLATERNGDIITLDIPPDGDATGSGATLTSC